MNAPTLLRTRHHEPDIDELTPERRDRIWLLASFDGDAQWAAVAWEMAQEGQDDGD